MPRTLYLRTLPILLLAALSNASCDSSGRADALGGLSTPLATAEGFVAAMNSSDSGALEKTLTVKARVGMQMGAGWSFDGGVLERVVYGTAVEDGSAAHITITATRDGKIEDVTLYMRSEENEWRIYAFEVGVPGQGSMKLDLEQMGDLASQLASAMGDGLQQAFDSARLEQEERGRAARRAMFDGLRPLTRAEFEGSWQVTEDHRGSPAKSVLSTLAGELGVPIRFGVAADRLLVPMATDLVGLSRLAAIDRILADHGCSANYPDPSALAANPIDLPTNATASPKIDAPPPSMSNLDGDYARRGIAAIEEVGENSVPAAIEVVVGEAPFPPVYFGPFRGAVTEVDQNPRYGTGSVTVTTRAYGLDPSLGGASAALNETLQFESVLDDRGHDLRESPDTHYLGGGDQIRGAMGNQLSIDLKGLLADVPQIARITGKQRVAVPTAVESLVIDPLVVGETGTIGEFTYEVKNIGPSVSITFRGDKTALESLSVVGMPFSETGAEVSVQYESTMAWGGDESQYQIQCQEAPQRLDLKCILRSEVFEFPFTLASVPLPDHERAIRAIPALEFQGFPQPASASFVKWKDATSDFPTVVLAISNHSNKDIDNLTCKFEYLDGAGKVLENFPHTMNGTASFEGVAPLAMAGKEIEHETTAFFVPAGTKSVRVKVQSVQFMDSSEWEEGSK